MVSRQPVVFLVLRLMINTMLYAANGWGIETWQKKAEDEEGNGRLHHCWHNDPDYDSSGEEGYFGRLSCLT